MLRVRRTGRAPRLWYPEVVRRSFAFSSVLVVVVGCAPGGYGGGAGEQDTSPGSEIDLSRGDVAVDPRTGAVFALRSVIHEDCSTDVYVDAIRAGAERYVPLATLGDQRLSRMFFPEGHVALLGGRRDGERSDLRFYDPGSLELTARYELDMWPSSFALDDGGRYLAASIPTDPLAAPPLDVADPLQEDDDAARAGDDDDALDLGEEGAGDAGPGSRCPSPEALPVGAQRALYLLDTQRLERVHLEVNADGLRLGWRTGRAELVVVAEDAPLTPGEARLRVMSYAITAAAPPPEDEPPPAALSSTSLPARVQLSLVLEGVRIARSTLSASRAKLVSDPSGRFSALPVDRVLSGREKCPRSGAPHCAAPAVLVVDHEQRTATVLRDLRGPVGFAATGELVAWQTRPTDDPRAKRRPALQLVVMDLARGESRGLELFVVTAPSFAFIPGTAMVLVGSSGWPAPLSIVDVHAGRVTRVAGPYGSLAPFVLDPARGAVWLLTSGLLRVDLDDARASETPLPFTPSALSLVPGRAELVLRRGLEPAVHFVSLDDGVWGSQRGALRLRSVRLGAAGEEP